MPAIKQEHCTTQMMPLSFSDTMRLSSLNRYVRVHTLQMNPPTMSNTPRKMGSRGWFDMRFMGLCGEDYDALFFSAKCSGWWGMENGCVNLTPNRPNPKVYILPDIAHDFSGAMSLSA